MAKKKGYGQFCPVAKAAEIVAERWTPLVLRELLMGSHRFGELKKGVPLMSPSLLSQRLKELEDAGVVERRPGEKAGAWEYHLTEAGQQLRPVVEMLGLWGHQWAKAHVRREDLDPGLLMWDVRRRVDPNGVPTKARTVVQFDLAGVAAKKARWWLVFDRGETDLCLKRPGPDVDLKVSAHIRTLTDVWMGHEDTRRAIRERALTLAGPKALVQSFPKWFALSVFAAAPEGPLPSPFSG